jgi:hypothetical protein
MRLKYLGILGLAGMLSGTAPMRAHHSFAAEYDSKTMLTLTGKINKVEWTNPHIYIHLDVPDGAGKITTWALEGYPPNTLKRTGFSRDLLKQGDAVTITAYKAKDGTNTGAAREVTFADGSKNPVGGAKRGWFAGPVGQ